MLTVKKLNAGYGKIQILRDISFHVGKGEVVSILGANGAGKTTLLRTISGLIRSWSGYIEFEGTAIDRKKPYQIVELGLIHVPEGRKLFTQMSIKENLQLGAYMKKNRASMSRNMERCFQLFPILKERMNQLAGSLSGGQQQMLAIARALMSQPRLLLLDEPSTGLSPLLTRQLFEVIRNIKAEGVTVLLVEQNAVQALGLSDRSYVIENGEFVMEGKSKDLLNDKRLRASYLGIMEEKESV